MASGVVAEVVEAFEINDVANDVYQHNFGHRPHQVSVNFNLPVEELKRNSMRFNSEIGFFKKKNSMFWLLNAYI